MNPPRFVSRALALLSACALGLPALPAATYYVDPATGSMSNPGTAAAPWSTLQAVFDAGKTFTAGDVVLLRSGYHGEPYVTGLITGGGVTIQSATGASPTLRRIRFTSASNWILSGVDICPEHAGAGQFYTGKIVDIYSSCSDVTIENCRIRAALSIAGWSVTDWQTNIPKTSNAIATSGLRTSLLGNRLENVGFGLVIAKPAAFSLISGNTIQAFYNDAIRGLADDCVFEFNTVKDSYVADGNHDDFFQSWSTDANGNVGQGTIYRVTLRNNVFLSRTDPSQPLYSPAQGIGCFDGAYEDWVIENNLIATQTYHGINLSAAINCRVVNNTVVENPLDGAGNSIRPWIRISTNSNGNLVRNNISAKPVIIVDDVNATVDHNLVTTAYATYFTDWSAFDFTLRATAPAVDAGDATNAPATDIDGRPRSVPYDVGAYEYGPTLREGFDYAATTDVSAAADSPSDTGWLGTTWTGTNDVVSPGLACAGVASAGNALQISANIGSVRSIDMTALPSSYTQLDSDAVTRLGKPGTTLWVRFLIRADEDDPTTALTTGLNLNGATTGGTVKLKIGDAATANAWTLIKGSTVAGSSAAIVTGETVLLVARIAFVAGADNDEVDLFVNPPLGLSPPATPTAMLRNTDLGTFDRVELKGTRTSTLDEITIATAWGYLF